MGGVSLQYSINDHLALAALGRMKNFDALPVFREIGAHLVSTTDERFRTSRSPEGEPWTPSQRVLAHRAEQRQNPRARPGAELTLVLQGHLRQSITYDASATGVKVGSGLDYAQIHQRGGDAGKNHSVHLPARPYLGLSPDDDDEIDLIVARHLRATMP